MTKRRNRKSRGSQGERTGNGDGSVSQRDQSAMDLMVVKPNNPSKIKVQLLIKDIMTRLTRTGFSHMALTHTIYGRPRPVEDGAMAALPSDLWMVQEAASSAKQQDRKGSSQKKRKLSNKSSKDIQVLRRLHTVVENLSDVGAYLKNSSQKELLDGYDLISAAPRNDATFQSVCATATMVDIITLDYSTSRGMRLPFKIRPSNVEAVIQRKAAFEIPLAPALLHAKYRKALAQTCAELQASCLRKKPLILFSSGDRTLEDSDVGAMALRMPGDLINLMQVVFHFDPTTSHQALSTSAEAVLQRAKERRWGKTVFTSATIATRDATNDLFEVPAASNTAKEESENEDEETPKSAAGLPVTKETGAYSSDSDRGEEDGFISMT